MGFFIFLYVVSESKLFYVHLLATNTTSAFRRSKNNCGRAHPFPNAFCKGIVSLRIFGELISIHPGARLSEEPMNKIQAKICDAYGKTDC